MRKSVILTISIIYVLSIVVVGFLGIALKVYNEKVYVDEIICITEGYEEVVDKEYDGVISFSFSKQKEVVIKCQVKPDNADITTLRYDIDDSKIGTFCELIENGDGTCTIKFLKASTVYLTIVPTDRSSNISLTIRIQCNPGIDAII